MRTYRTGQIGPFCVVFVDNYLSTKIAGRNCVHYTKDMGIPQTQKLQERQERKNHRKRRIRRYKIYRKQYSFLAYARQVVNYGLRTNAYFPGHLNPNLDEMRLTALRPVPKCIKDLETPHSIGALNEWQLRNIFESSKCKYE
eukprot:GHVL01014726.1.p1 GENE.GHVL01014726.1~~GHVL01014726.1.p1  ORF type:complete len:142 (-),score=11.77 GHVL01014726.1:123-548(-)